MWATLSPMTLKFDFKNFRRNYTSSLLRVNVLSLKARICFPDVNLRPPLGRICIFMEASDEDHHAHFFDADRLNLDEAGHVRRLKSTRVAHRRFSPVIQPLVTELFDSDPFPITIQDKAHLIR